MTEREVENLIEEFMTRVPQGADRRKHERIRYRKIAVLVLIDRPGGDTSFLVMTNNISLGGLAFRHASSLAPGTPCKIKIMLRSGGSLESRGTIVRCRTLEGNAYEIGLQFDQLLDVSMVAPQKEAGLSQKLRQATSAVFQR